MMKKKQKPDKMEKISQIPMMTMMMTISILRKMILKSFPNHPNNRLLKNL